MDARTQIAEILGCHFSDCGPEIQHFEAADAILAALPSLQGWQPIETAPKDGAYAVDLWVIPFTGKQHRRCDMWWLNSKKWQGWRGGNCHIQQDGYPSGDFVGSSYDVTHWKPLDPPPVLADMGVV